MKTDKKEKLTYPFRKLLVCLLSYHLISPSAWRTKMKRKLPAMKELLMQICCTDTLTLSLNMIFTNDDDDDDDYKDHQFTTTTTEHSLCLSCWSSWSSRDMIQAVRGREIAVAIPDIMCPESFHKTDQVNLRRPDRVRRSGWRQEHQSWRERSVEQVEVELRRWGHRSTVRSSPRRSTSLENTMPSELQIKI